MAEPNDQLRRARENVASPNASGDCLSRQELAELVNTWVFEHTQDHRIVELDANYLGKLEQGKIRWPRDAVRRAGLRAVLGITTDAELGFRRPRRSHIMRDRRNCQRNSPSRDDQHSITGVYLRLWVKFGA